MRSGFNCCDTVLFVLTYHAIIARHTGSAEKKLRDIPIGLVVDRESSDILNSFQFAVDRFNGAKKEASEFRIMPKISILEVTDSFAISNAICQKLDEGVYGIIGISNSSALATIQSYSNTFKVPFVTLSFAHNFTTPASFQLFMRPINTDAIIDLLQFHRWTWLIYLYNSDEGLMRLQELFQALNLREYQLEINVKRVSDTNSCLAMLKEVYLRSLTHKINILLDFSIEKADTLLTMLVEATNIDLARFHIILADLRLEKWMLQKYVQTPLNITGFQLIYFEGDTARHTVDFWSTITEPFHSNKKHITCQEALTIDSVELFAQAINGYLESLRTLDRQGKQDDMRNDALPLRCTDSAVVKWTNRTPLMNIMKNISFQGLTGDVAFDENGFRKDFSLDVIELSPSNGVQKIGYWTQRDRLFLYSSVASLQKTYTTFLNNTKIVTMIDSPS